MGLNVLLLLSSSGFKFLGGRKREQETKKKNKKLSLLEQTFLPCLGIAERQAILSVAFSTLKITFSHAKETSRCLMADCNNGSRKAISSKGLA